MPSKQIHVSLLAAIAVLACCTVLSLPSSAHAQTPYYNYYVAPGAGYLGAQMYPCPRPTPPLVGHTIITYQPLNPHEFLYPHHRTYYNYHPSGVTKTRVRWH